MSWRWPRRLKAGTRFCVLRRGVSWRQQSRRELSKRDRSAKQYTKEISKMRPVWSKALRFRNVFRQLTVAALSLLLAAPAFAQPRGTLAIDSTPLPARRRRMGPRRPGHALDAVATDGVFEGISEQQIVTGKIPTRFVVGGNQRDRFASYGASRSGDLKSPFNCSAV